MKKIKFYHISFTALLILIAIIVFNYFQYLKEYNALTIELQTTELVNHDITVHIKGDLSNVKAYSFDNGVTWQEENSYIVQNNQSLECFVKYNNGKISKRIIYNITNIDKMGPTITFEKDTKVLLNQYIDLSENITVTDDISGISNNGNLTIEPTVISTSTLGAKKVIYTAEDNLGNVTSIERTIYVVEQILDQDGNSVSPITQYRYRTKQSVPYDCEYDCEKTVTETVSSAFSKSSACCSLNGQEGCTASSSNAKIVGSLCLTLNQTDTLTREGRCAEGYAKYENNCYAIESKMENTCPSGYTLKDNTCQKTVTEKCSKTCYKEEWSAWSDWSSIAKTPDEKTQVETRNIGE